MKGGNGMLRGPFQNEPGDRFSIPENRQAMLAALDEVEQQLGQRYPLVIGGERRESGEWFKSINPGNLDQVVGEVARATAQDVSDAIAAAEVAFATWRNMSAEGRASVNFRMAAIMRRRRLELAAWMSFELDKAWDEGRRRGRRGDRLPRILWPRGAATGPTSLGVGASPRRGDRDVLPADRCRRRHPTVEFPLRDS